ncbi:daptide biosynthesis intramembrane metalloprotease [Amycolatopsis sp. NPDC059021]|uniref:daptide biosynthesis intramembrane metalloprotease n=1 Tax=Amycolatopsis sp. NPDC059021 TaxID=3346704 RepID=UPI00366A600B
MPTTLEAPARAQTTSGDGTGRPELAADVIVHPPVSAQGHWTVQRGHDRYARVSGDAARLLRALDGTRTVEQLTVQMGPGWSVSTVATALEAFAERGWLEDGTRRRTRPRRIGFVRPLTVQLTLFDPSRMLRRLRPFLVQLAGRGGICAALLGASTALAVLLSRRGDLGRVLGEPLPLPTVAMVLGLALAGTAVHEFGHAAVLVAHGGSPRRMGVMLFYLVPAFFCDVTDAWRLPRKRQRVAVALAGNAAEAIFAGTAALISLALGQTTAGQVVLLYVAFAMGRSVFNLIPFVKLDGYLALMSHLDIPHLRDKATADARSAFSRHLFGGTRPPMLRRRGWAVAFGVCCIVFPLVLLGRAALVWASLLPMFGLVGALLALGLVAFLVLRLGMAAGRMIRSARASGAARTRVVAVTLLLTAAAGAVLAFVHLPTQLSTAYITTPGGITAVVPAGTAPALPAGAPVTLHSGGGLLTGGRNGSATLADAPAGHAQVPMSAFVPAADMTTPVPVTLYRLRGIDHAPADHGTAVITTGSTPLAAWLVDHYLSPALRRIAG